MVGDAIAHGFNEDGLTSIRERHTAGFLGNFTYSEDIISIDPDGVNTIADTAASNTISPVLLQGGRGYCISVVSADEYYRAGACRSDVERSMEVAFASGTFTKIAGYYS